MMAVTLNHGTGMTPTKTRRDFAISSAHTHHSRESVQSSRRCRETYKSIMPHGSLVRARLVATPRANHWYSVTRTDDVTSALARLDDEMAQLRNAGLTETQMMAIEQHVATTRELLFDDAPPRPLEVLDLEDFESDMQEERLEKARNRGESTPATLMHEAEANFRQAAVSTEKGRTLYYMARIIGANAKTPATVRAATGVRLSPSPMEGHTAETSPRSERSIYSARQQCGRGV